MKISECAELTGVSVRTIRYYHARGLVPIPPSTGGIRDYSMSHVARILRIRWLAGAGLSLSAIAPMLDDEVGTGQADLEAAAAVLDARIAELQAQRQRVLDMIAGLDGTETITPTVKGFYTTVMARVDDPEARSLVAREMRLAELLTLRGLIPRPVELDRVIEKLDDAAVERAALFYTRFAILPRLGEAEARTLEDELIADVTRWAHDYELLTEATLDLIPDWGFTTTGKSMINGFMRLLCPHRRQADLLARLIEELMVR